MTHFAIMVVGRNVEEQLAPYDEDGEFFRASDGNPYELLGVERTATYDQVRAAAETKLAGLPNADDDEEDYPQNGTAEEKDAYWEGAARRRQIEKARDMLTDFDQRERYDREGPRPDSKWDWWTVGGRWPDYLLLKDGSRADAAPKGRIDVEGMRETARRNAEEWWDTWEQVTAGTERPRPWSEYIARANEAAKPVAEGTVKIATYSFDQAREDYGAQERVKRVRAHDDAQYRKGSDQRPLLGFLGSCDDVPETREEFVKDRVDGALALHAYVQGGVWTEDGRMGWWGMKMADRDEREPLSWNAEFNAWFDALPDDAMITVVDCHV